MSSLVPSVLELDALRRMPRNVFSILLSLEPVFAALGGMLLLHQSTGAIRWAAIAILVAASVGVTLTHRTKSAEAEFDDNEMMLESMPATGAIPIIIQHPQETEIEEHDSLADHAHIELDEQVEEERIR